MTAQDIQQDLCHIYGPSHYYTTTYSKQELDYSGKVAEWLLAETAGKGPVLDVGPAYGTLSALASSQGCLVTCIDVIRYLSGTVESKYWLRLRKANIETDEFEFSHHFHTVILTEVLEHFNYNSIPTLWKIKNMMKEDGVLLLSTPDADSWGRVDKAHGGKYDALSEIPSYRGTALDKEPWFDGHVWQYTEAELRHVLTCGGFEIRDLEYSTSPGGRHFNIRATILKGAL